MSNKKKYKALMLDIDGTLVVNDLHALPSKKVTDAIREANKFVHIGVATGRPMHAITHLLDHLSLTGPCVVNGGIQIVDAKSKRILKQQAMLRQDIMPVIEAAKIMHIGLDVSNQGIDAEYSEGYPLEDILGLFTKAIDEDIADIFVNSLNHIPTIAVHKTSSWVQNKVHVEINHISATKQHGIFEVAQILNIETSDIIGVGDHYNDFPLLMACGLKVAMGNAVDDIKAIADYIAPSVDDDGVADVIEKFIL